MFDFMLILFGILYAGIIVLLFAYSANSFYLIYLSWRNQFPQAASSPPTKWPEVTVQLPIYNEQYVVERLIKASTNLDYPKDLLEIQVLDDSTDETREIVKNSVNTKRLSGIDISLIHREKRIGYKAGALAHGLKSARGDYIVLFDADFIPPPDFLRKTIPYFQDPGIAFVQTRWGHLNRDYSLVTHLQALTLDAHFMIDQHARFRGGYWFNFNGTAGVWRKKAIEDAGGWMADTLTEDLDLSYRAFLKGWEALYLKDLEVPAELPINMSAFRRQQHRWARGSFECALKLLPEIWRKNGDVRRKIEATLHLTNNFVYLLLFLLIILYPVAIILSTHYVPYINIIGFLVILVLNFSALVPSIYFVAAQKQMERPWWRFLHKILFVNVFMAGMMVNTTRAAVQAVIGKSSVFERTPKFGSYGNHKNWFNNSYRLKFDNIVWIELLFALLNSITIYIAINEENWIILFYASLFCAGLLFTSLVTIGQAVSSWRQRH